MRELRELAQVEKHDGERPFSTPAASASCTSTACGPVLAGRSRRVTVMECSGRTWQARRTFFGAAMLASVMASG